MNWADDLLLSGVLYIACVAVTVYLHKREASQSPEKGYRYLAVPIGYKALCYFGVLPLFAASFVFPALFVLALVAFMVTEILCVKWYRKKGLL